VSRRRTPEDWRRAVFRSTVSDKTKVVLLYLADFMRQDMRVSVPRVKVATDLKKSERRITDRITEAHEAGLLDTVVRGRKYVTAVYQCTFPDALSRTPTSPLRSAKSVPLRGPEHALSGTDGCPTISRADLSVSPHGRDVGSNEETEIRRVASRLTACEFHHWQPCPEDCRNAHRESA
jgi:hypothetical protein